MTEAYCCCPGCGVCDSVGKAEALRLKIEKIRKRQLRATRAWREAEERIRVLENAIHDYLEGNDNRLKMALSRKEVEGE